MKIIERIFKAMELKNIKNVQLAEHLGVSKSVISSWKSRNNNPPAEMIVQICELIKESPIYILTGKEESNNLTNEEIKLLEKYNLLTEKNKGIIEYLIDERLKEQYSETSVTRDLA